MSSGSRMFSDGRMRAPRVGAVMVAISVPAAAGGEARIDGATNRRDGLGSRFHCLACRA